MTTRKRFTVRRGDTVSLAIPVQTVTQKEAIAVETEQENKNVLPYDELDDQYTFRKNVLVRFFDLGTRLRSVPSAPSDPLRQRSYPTADNATPNAGYYDEYIEVTLDNLLHGFASYQLDVPDPSAVWTGAAHITLAGSTWKLMDDMLLGRRTSNFITGDPLDTLDPTGSSIVNETSTGDPSHVPRKLPNCMPLYLSNDARTRGLVFVLPRSLTIGTDLIQIINNTLDDVLAHWHSRVPSDNDANERWNLLNVSSGAAFMQLSHDRNLFINKSGRLLVIAGDNYFSFDTGHAAYKVTATDQFTDAAAEFSFKGKDNRIYLRPLYTGYYLIDHPYALATSSLGNVGIPGDTVYHSVGATPPLTHFFFTDHAFHVVGRTMPIYPALVKEPSSILGRIAFDDSITYDVDEVFLDFAKRNFWLSQANLSSQAGSHPSPIIGTMPLHQDFPDLQMVLRHGSLVALVTQDDKVFYVWANQDLFGAEIPA